MYKSQLNQLCQTYGLTPVYNITNRSGPPHNPEFIVECHVNDYSVKSDSFHTLKEAENHSAYLLYNNIKDILTDSCGLPKMPSPTDQNSDITENSNLPMVTVFIDGDNVHEIHPWIKKNRQHWVMRMFVSKNTVVKHDIKVYRSISDYKDATDVAMIIYTTRYISLMEEDETLIIVSRDNIFHTLIEELVDKRIKLCKTIDDLNLI